MSDDFELPDSWIIKPLGEAARLVKDKVEPSTVPDAYYIGLEHVDAHTMRLNGHGRGSDVKSAKTKFAAGDVLYGKLRPYLNKVTRAPFDGISSTDFLVFTESDDLDAGYLAQFLNQLSVANYAHHRSSGVELPRVDWKSLSALPIAFPLSKSEQRKLVAQIEQARALSASAEDHLTQARTTIERFRQSVLVAAYSGRLTEDWRESQAVTTTLSEHRENLERQRQGEWGSRTSRKYTPPVGVETADLPEIPIEWSWISADGACSQITDGEHIQPPYVEDGLPMLTAKHVRNGYVDGTHAGLISPSDFQKARERCAPTIDDLLVVSVGATTGRAAIVEQSEPFAIVRSVLLLRPIVTSRFLLRWLQNPWTHHWMTVASGASAQPHLYIRDVKRLPVPLPLPDEQLEIVRRVDGLLALVDSFGRTIELASHRIDRSVQAIVAKAIRGELFQTTKRS